MIRKLTLAVMGLLVVLAGGAAVYYWNEVRQARADTTMLVESLRREHGRRVKASGLPAARIDSLLRIEDPDFRSHKGVDLAHPAPA